MFTYFKKSVFDWQEEDFQSVTQLFGVLGNAGVFDLQQKMRDPKIVAVFTSNEMFKFSTLMIARFLTLEQLGSACKCLIVCLQTDPTKQKMPVDARVESMLKNIIQHHPNSSARAIMAVIFAHFVTRGL